MSGYTSMAQSSCAYDKGSVISEVKIKYDSDTGKPYNIVKAYNDWWKADTGASVEEGMYYIYKQE